jgi:hypothetical protein
MTTSDTIDYATFIDNAMRGAVRDILRQVDRSGLPGKHHFFISYRTDYPGIEISPALKNKYPKEITIVLQHQFWDLRVEEDKFSVSLSFSNVPEKLVIPFAALTGFADPSTKFGLKFHNLVANHMGGTEEESKTAADEVKESAEIIALDAFRKKK